MDSWIYGFTETRRGEAAAERYGTSILENTAKNQILMFWKLWFYGFMVSWLY